MQAPIEAPSPLAKCDRLAAMQLELAARPDGAPKPEPFSREALENELNQAQVEAVLAPPGPLLVVAGAGSGKTRVITYRLARLVATGADPRRILAVTFTNKAAGELRERVDKLLWDRMGIGTRGLWVGTFHATSARILRQWGQTVGLRKDFVIYDDDDQKRLLARVLTDLKVPERMFPVRQVLSAIDRAKNQGLTAASFVTDDYFDDVVGKAYKLYEERLAAANATDFGGLLLSALQLVASGTPAAQEIARALRPRAGRRVPGHQQRPVPAGAAARAPHGQHHRRRRRGPVDLPLARRRHPQHPRLRARPPRRPGREAGAQLPLDRPHPARRQRDHREEQRAAAEAPLHRGGRRRADRPVRGGDRARRGGVRRLAHRGGAVGDARAARLRGLLPDQRPVARARGRAARPRSPLRGRGRHALLRPRRDQEPGRLPARGRQPRRRPRAPAHHQRPGPRHRRHHRRPHRRPHPRAQDLGLAGAGAGGRRRGAAVGGAAQEGRRVHRPHDPPARPRGPASGRRRWPRRSSRRAATATRSPPRPRWRRRGGWRTCSSSWPRCASTSARPRSRPCTGSSSASRWPPTSTATIRKRAPSRS